MTELRRTLHALIDQLVDAVEQAGPKSEWVDQKDSPLGRQRHTALVRAGKLPGVKDGKSIMVRRADIEAYLEKNRVRHVDEAADERDEIKRLAAEFNRGSAA